MGTGGSTLGGLCLVGKSPLVWLFINVQTGQCCLAQVCLLRLMRLNPLAPTGQHHSCLSHFLSWQPDLSHRPLFLLHRMNQTTQGLLTSRTEENSSVSLSYFTLGSFKEHIQKAAMDLEVPGQWPPTLSPSMASSLLTVNLICSHGPSSSTWIGVCIPTHHPLAFLCIAHATLLCSLAKLSVSAVSYRHTHRHRHTQIYTHSNPHSLSSPGNFLFLHQSYFFHTT